MEWYEHEAFRILMVLGYCAAILNMFMSIDVWELLFHFAIGIVLAVIVSTYGFDFKKIVKQVVCGFVVIIGFGILAFAIGV